MKLSRELSLVLAVVFLTVMSPAFTQTAPAAYQGHLPFTIGAGVSNYAIDWDNQRMFGITVTGQWRPGFVPNRLYGLGIDIEGRDIDYDRPHVIASNFRQDTVAGGPIYTSHHFRKFQPYAKFLVGIGSIDFHSRVPHYDHDTRTIYAPGGGIQYWMLPHLWVRADYEYQMWPGLFRKTLDPQGVTLGASYDFRSFWHSR